MGYLATTTWDLPGIACFQNVSCLVILRMLVDNIIICMSNVSLTGIILLLIYF